VDLESVKISGSDSGILREEWEKKFDPLNLPPTALGGHGTPNFFPWESTESLHYCQISRPCDKNWGLGGRGKFLIFFKSNLQHEVWQRACTRANYCFYFILQGTKFAKKKFEDRVLNFFPVLEIWPPKLLPIFGKFLPKNSRRPYVRDIRAKLDRCTELSWEMSSNSTFGHNLWVVSRLRGGGAMAPRIYHGQEVTLAIFGQFPWPNRTSWVNSFYSTLWRDSSRKKLNSAFWISFPGRSCMHEK